MLRNFLRRLFTYHRAMHELDENQRVIEANQRVITANAERIREQRAKAETLCAELMDRFRTVPR